MVKSSDTQGNMQFGVDKGLISMFLKMSPEERLQTNDNAVRTIAELRNAFKQQKKSSRRSKRSA
jgi:hypothetical protein